jgi:excisionase family DNA binding protein
MGESEGESWMKGLYKIHDTWKMCSICGSKSFRERKRVYSNGAVVDVHSYCLKCRLKKNSDSQALVNYKTEGEKMNNSDKREGLAKVVEVADFLRLSRAAVYRIMDRGELPYAKLGQARRIRWADVHSYIERSMMGAKPNE